MAGVQFRGVSKSFGDVAVLRNINLEIEDGEFVVFVGPSGCGKSTLLRVIAGLEDITSGDLFIDNARVNDVAPSERGIAMVFQSYALYPHMSLYENMAFGLRLAKMPKAEIDAAVKSAAKILHIDHLLDRKPRALSGGERQRVAIGRAIGRKPKVFLFDEPLSNLDAALRIKMRIEFAKLHSDLKTTMVYVTHDQVEAMTLAHKMVVLSQGNIEQVGAPLALYHHPINRFVATFIGAPRMNLINGEVAAADETGAEIHLSTGETLRAAVDARRAKAGDKVAFGIRPEHFAFAGAQNVIRAKVQFLEAHGEATYAYLEYAPAAEGLTARLSAEQPIRKHETLTLCAPALNGHLFDAAGSAFPRHYCMPGAKTADESFAGQAAALNSKGGTPR